MPQSADQGALCESLSWGCDPGCPQIVPLHTPLVHTPPSTSSIGAHLWNLLNLASKFVIAISLGAGREGEGGDSGRKCTAVSKETWKFGQTSIALSSTNLYVTGLMHLAILKGQLKCGEKLPWLYSEGQMSCGKPHSFTRMEYSDGPSFSIRWPALLKPLFTPLLVKLHLQLLVLGRMGLKTNVMLVVWGKAAQKFFQLPTDTFTLRYDAIRASRFHWLSLAIETFSSCMIPMRENKKPPSCRSSSSRMVKSTIHLLRKQQKNWHSPLSALPIDQSPRPDQAAAEIRKNTVKKLLHRPGLPSYHWGAGISGFQKWGLAVVPCVRGAYSCNSGVFPGETKYPRARYWTPNFSR